MKYKLDMLYLKALDSRIEQTDFQLELRNKMLGFEGELAVDQMLNLSNQIIYRHDLEFVAHKQIQIDFLVVHNNQLSILEVKNYFGDFEIYETCMKNAYNHQYPSPFIQMDTTKNTLNQILYSNNIKIPINEYLIFPNETFSARTTIPHRSKVLLRSEFYKFPKLFQSYQIATDQQLLQQICQLQTPFSHKYKSIDKVDFSKINKGLKCPNCKSIHTIIFEKFKKFSICQNCNKTIKRDELYRFNILELAIINGESGFTIDEAVDWCEAKNIFTVKKICNQNLSSTGERYKKYYLNLSDEQLQSLGNLYWNIKN
ncbi:nuclease-related domain-containing protein [Mammaliicoccus sp. Dog046]|uniref:nuclease-related domain-containing protein n=1 Tax=Mammaliicoccus sp. Dog046 TaxID=3034233 RepID=UPI002B261F52|nr:nuclease-related domain-containing protein [Mammaliicoccus sp. Dog046]WQK84560.1 nuclease-related domain-containing protein [Mammaliicoccus sp. Dog046]